MNHNRKGNTHSSYGGLGFGFGFELELEPSMMVIKL